MQREEGRKLPIIDKNQFVERVSAERVRCKRAEIVAAQEHCEQKRIFNGFLGACGGRSGVRARAFSAGCPRSLALVRAWLIVWRSAKAVWPREHLRSTSGQCPLSPNRPAGARHRARRRAVNRLVRARWRAAKFVRRCRIGANTILNH